MPERNDKILGHAQRKTFSEAADEIMSQGVGRRYETYGELWDMPENERTVGLLELVLTEIREIRKGNDSDRMLEEHRSFLKYWFDDVTKLIDQRNKLVGKIRNKFPKLGYNSQLSCNGNIHIFSWLYRTNLDQFNDRIEDLEKQIALLKTIKTVDDLKKFDGIGPKTLAKIKAQQEVSDGN